MRSIGAGWITLSAAGAAGRLALLGSGKVVTGSIATGLGSVLSLGCGAAEVIGRGSGAGVRVAAVRPLGGALIVVAGALGTGVGLGAGTGLGAGLGRATGPRTIGLSASTGPCDRGLLVGRAPGIEKSGKVCAAANPGTSAAASAAAPVAAPMLPPNFRITCPVCLWCAR